MISNAQRMFNFDLGETADAIRETVQKFSANEIAPRAAEIDKSNLFPRDLWPKLGALGLPDDLRASLTNSTNADAYPIVAMTYLLTYKDVTDKGKALAMARFFWWGTHDGQAFAKDLGYAPLPADVQAKVEAKIRSITSGGQPMLPAN